MESTLHLTLLLELFLVGCSHAQGVIGTTAGSKTLAPWLVGLTAVMCFLFVIFTASLVNRFFCSGRKGTEETPERDVELRTTPNVYDNMAMGVEEASSRPAKANVEDDKQTKM